MPFPPLPCSALLQEHDVKEAEAAAKGPPAGARASDKESLSNADVARLIVVKEVGVAVARALLCPSVPLLCCQCYAATCFHALPLTCPYHPLPPTLPARLPAASRA